MCNKPESLSEECSAAKALTMSGRGLTGDTLDLARLMSLRGEGEGGASVFPPTLSPSSLRGLRGEHKLVLNSSADSGLEKYCLLLKILLSVHSIFLH